MVSCYKSKGFELVSLSNLKELNWYPVKKSKGFKNQYPVTNLKNLN